MHNKILAVCAIAAFGLTVAIAVMDSGIWSSADTRLRLLLISADIVLSLVAVVGWITTRVVGAEYANTRAALVAEIGERVDTAVQDALDQVARVNVLRTATGGHATVSRLHRD